MGYRLIQVNLDNRQNGGWEENEDFIDCVVFLFCIYSMAKPVFPVFSFIQVVTNF